MFRRRILVALLTGIVSTALAVSIAGAVGAGGSSRKDEPQAAPTTAPASATLTIRVTDLRNHCGQLMFGVFASGKGFPSDSRRAVNWQIRALESGETEFVCDLPPGSYAASVLHDENSNNKLDQNFFGVPREGYGVTNNPKPRFRGARFGEATITLPPDGATYTISLQYF